MSSDCVMIIPQDPKQDCPMSMLSDEFLLYIFTFLPELNVVPRIERTCKLFQILSSEEVLWQQRFELRFPDISPKRGRPFKGQVQCQLHLEKKRNKHRSENTQPFDARFDGALTGIPMGLREWF